MKTFAITLAGLSLLAAGSALASERVSDLDYLKASRCKGIAQGLGQTDTAGLDAFLKAAGRGRSAYISERSEAEMARGKQTTRGRKEQAAAEFASVCAAYMAGPTDVAARAKSSL